MTPISANVTTTTVYAVTMMLMHCTDAVAMTMLKTQNSGSVSSTAVASYDVTVSSMHPMSTAASRSVHGMYTTKVMVQAASHVGHHHISTSVGTGHSSIVVQALVVPVPSTSTRAHACCLLFWGAF